MARRFPMACGPLYLSLALLLALGVFPSSAQEETPSGPDREEAPAASSSDAGDDLRTPAGEAASATTSEAIPPRPPGVKVTAVSPEWGGLGDVLIVTVQGLGSELESPEPRYTCADLILFLNDMPILGSQPESCSIEEGGNVQVRFLLDRTKDSDPAWHALLEEPISFMKKIPVSVGATERLPFPSRVKDFKLEMIPKVELFGYFAILVLALALFIRLARHTPLLRDRTPLPEGQTAPYSLSRFQLAFWSFLVIAAYVFIWMITEELDTITGSVLTLLGIGSGTALGAAVIDSGRKPIVPADTAGAAPAPKPRVSQGFLNDVLSDEQGLSLYRFQLFAWTLVLGVIFCASVYNGLAMPQFSTTLLGLMGLSSGTYLGFKVPESKSAPPPEG